MQVYKYLSSRRVDAFLSEGKVHFSSLSYFRDYEDQQAVGDRFEGIRTSRPPEGLVVTKSTGETFRVAGFDSAVSADEVFVFCTSMAMRRDLAREFKTDACIVIRDVEEFASRLAGALPPAEPSPNVLLHRPVFYYSLGSPQGTDWARPERIIMGKTDYYHRQREYRFAFAPADILALHQTTQQLVLNSGGRAACSNRHRHQELVLGGLRDICDVRRWP